MDVSLDWSYTDFTPPVDGARRPASLLRILQRSLQLSSSDSTLHHDEWSDPYQPDALMWPGAPFEPAQMMMPLNTQTHWGEITDLVQHRNQNEGPWAPPAEQGHSHATELTSGHIVSDYETSFAQGLRAGHSLRGPVSGINSQSRDSGLALSITQSGPSKRPYSESLSEASHRRRARGSGAASVCLKCKRKLKNPSEARKHAQQHEKPFKCKEDGCPRHEGFATRNDLERHRKSVHGLQPQVGNRLGYVCQACPTAATPKFWSRKDNFNAHIKRKHPEYGEGSRLEQLLEQSTCPRENVIGVSTISESGYMSKQSASEVFEPDAISNIEETSECPLSSQSFQGEQTMFSAHAKMDSEAMVAGEGTWTDSVFSSIDIAASQHRTVYDDGQTHQTLVENARAIAGDHNGPLVDTEMQSVTAYASGQDLQSMQCPGGQYAVAAVPVRDNSTASSSSLGSQLTGTMRRSVSNVFQHPCRECLKSFPRPCDLRKHEKRHERPYGCTFPKCRRTFGSRNDWKRHEDGQHFLSDMWRCEYRATCPSKCGKLCFDKAQFMAHLQRIHQVRPDALEQKCETMHLGREASRRFWCGFCNALIPQPDDPQTSAVSYRFKHIGDHVDKEGCHIETWIDIDENIPRGPNVENDIGKGKRRADTILDEDQTNSTDIFDTGAIAAGSFEHASQLGTMYTTNDYHDRDAHNSQHYEAHIREGEADAAGESDDDYD